MRRVPRVFLLSLGLSLAPFVPTAVASVFAVSADGVVRMHGNILCPGPACTWVDIGRDSGNLTLAASRDRLFLLRRNGSVWQWSGLPCESDRTCAQWTDVGASINAIAIATNDNDLFALRGSGAVFRLVDACHAGRCDRWQQIDRDGGIAEIRAAGAKVFKRRRNGEIFEWTGAACTADGVCRGWRQIDNNPNTQEIAVAAPGELYQRHRSGGVWRWKGGACTGASCRSWEQIDANPATQRLATARGALYQLHRSGAIWRFLGAACTPAGCGSWQLLGDDARTTAIAAVQSYDRQWLYQARQDGSVLRYLTIPCVGAACWTTVGVAAFTPSGPAAGGLYAFESRVWTGATSRVLQAEDFGFGDYGTFATLRSRPNKSTINVLILMSSYANTRFDPGRTREFYAQKFFGPTNRLSRYFNDNSRLREFDIQLAGVEQVFDRRTMNCAHRWDTCEEATDGALHTKATVEHLEMLPPGAARKYARYDLNGDGEINSDELLVIKIEGMPEQGVIGPYSDNCGNTLIFPSSARLRGTTKWISDQFIAVGDDANFITVAHEVAHLFGALDIRGSGMNAGLTTMGPTCVDVERMYHLDPWHKMRMGLVRPRIFAIPDIRSEKRRTRLTVPVNRAAYEPVLLYRAENPNEYFMLEYRRAASGTFDFDVPASGLVIWHVFTGSDHRPLSYTDPVFGGGIPESAAVAVIGAPDQTIGSGEAWTSGNGEIALRWPGRGDSGLRLQVVEKEDTYLTVEWWRE